MFKEFVKIRRKPRVSHHPARKSTVAVMRIPPSAPAINCARVCFLRYRRAQATNGRLKNTHQAPGPNTYNNKVAKSGL
jgi:hypothetical protein